MWQVMNASIRVLDKSVASLIDNSSLSSAPPNSSINESMFCSLR